MQKNIILSVETTDEISSDWKWYFTPYVEQVIISTRTDDRFLKGICLKRNYPVIKNIVVSKTEEQL